MTGIVAVVYIWSWLHMCYFARLIARDRLFVAALDRKEFEHGSPEAERYWRTLRVEVDPCDSAGVPNWITRVNMGATATALVLHFWGIVAYWQVRAHSPNALIDTAIVISVGLTLFFVIGQLIDTVVFRLAVGQGDPLAYILADGPNPRRRFVLNILRPVILTVIIFGGGLLTVALLDVNTWAAIGAGLYFFFLTQIACLAGRGASLSEAGWAMVITGVLLIGAFIALRNLP